MATIHIPDRSRRKGIHRHGETIPYILDCEDKYVEGYNHYIVERARGRVNLVDPTQPRAKYRPLSMKSTIAVAQRLCDSLTFLESPMAHPALGRIEFNGVKRWHFADLYAQAMQKGYWTRQFWQTGVPAPLSFESTSGPRVDEATRCHMWMNAHGYVSRFDEIADDAEVERNLADALHNYELIGDSFGPLVYPQARTRQNPGDMIPPTVAEIREVITKLPSGGLVLAALTLFETGIRAFELLDRMHIPPSWFGGGPRKTGGSDPGWLPDLHVVWPHSGEPNLKLHKWRVRGKAETIRYSRIPPRLLRALWRYANGLRAKIIRKSKSSKVRASTELFVNRDGGALNYDNLCQALRKANDELDRSERITPHVLRHAYACRYLEVNLVKQMRLSGIDPDTASYEQFMSIGSGILVILKQNLGHKFFETTLIYLEQLAHGHLALRYQSAFNESLDELSDLLEESRYQ